MANSRKDFERLELVLSEYSLLNLQISHLELGERHADIISRCELGKVSRLVGSRLSIRICKGISFASGSPGIIGVNQEFLIAIDRDNARIDPKEPADRVHYHTSGYFIFIKC
jgi:hypothetical protein